MGVTIRRLLPRSGLVHLAGNRGRLKVRHHEPVDALLPALGPLAVVLPDHLRTVSEYVGHLLERGAPFPQQPSGEGVPIPVGVRDLTI